MAGVIGALAETAISNLLGAVTNLLKEKADVILNANDDLKNLQEKLKFYQKVIKDADCKPFLSSERDRELEEDFKDVLYDAEDIIEEYQSKIEVTKKDNGSTSTNKVCKCFDEHASFPLQLGYEIKKINQRLDEIKKDWDMDLLKPKPKESSQGHIGGQDDNPPETTHHIGAQPPIGRENDKRVIVDKLLSNGSWERNVSIISIVGEGGIGKTALAKMVFSEVEQQFGERRWWVCVSERPNHRDLSRKILKEVYKGSTAGLEGIITFSDLCTQIQDELSKKRFLLVLDDVWELDWWQGEVESTLMRGAMGSKILITSPNIDVSKGIGALYMHRLPILPEEESWNLFLNKASRTENDLASHNLQDTAKKIVKKCGGLPLVVQTVGSLMRTKSMEKAEWEVVADSVIWDWKMPASSSSSQYGSIFPGLILSYDDLPPYLSSCFVYCSIFPKDNEIEREGLIMQWVAHGLVEEKEGVDVEVTANQYIEDLIRRCLIEETHDRVYGGTYLKLHDILHDLASYIGGKEYSHAYATEHTRHLSLLGVDDADAAVQCNALGATNKMRTLLLSEYLSSVEFTNFKWLRVLSLRETQMDELPNSIEFLLLLKYLDLSWSEVRQLPRSIGELHNLQTLNLSYSKIEELPEEMGKLCNLRYLGLKGARCLDFIAEGLGKLTNLRTLDRFLVYDDKGDTRGCNIRELKDLNKLKGELLIEGLGGGRVKVIDAVKAQLKEKHELIGVKLEFKLRWDCEVDSAFKVREDDKVDSASEVGEDDKVDSASEHRSLLEALEPPHGIGRLTICDYEGDRPGWYLDSNFEELQTLELRHCSLLATVIGIKSLEKLEVYGSTMLKTLVNMPALESLKVRDCGSLEQVAEMHALKSLEVGGSSVLKTLANIPSLESLKVRDCGSLDQVAEMPALRSLEVGGSTMLKTLDNMPALESLKVRFCGSLEQIAEMPSLRSLEVGGSTMLKTLANMPALESLKVRDCSSLEQVAEMPALRSLEVGESTMLKTLVDIPALESLKVIGCGSLEQVAEMPALRSLEVGGSTMLKTLANMPVLESLKVRDCGSLEQVAEMPALRSLEVGGSTMLKTLASIPALESSEVRDCSSLEQVVEMPARRSLKVYKCNMLKILANMPALESLEIECCDSLEQVAEMSALSSLEVQGCNMLKTLTNILALESLMVDECGSLQQVAEMPVVKSLNVNRCNMLKTLANMPSLESLYVEDCDSLEQVVEMSALRLLDVGNCNMLKTLTNMPGLESLHVVDCDSLEQVTEMPALNSLVAYRCNMLKTLANMPALKSLQVESLGLKTLASMPALESLDVSNCDVLEQVAEMPALTSLCVFVSNMLKTLVNMPALDWLVVRYCDSLEQVAEMPALRSLEVQKCNMLKTLANMPALESLQVTNCDSLEQVAEMSALRSLEVGDCNMLKTLTNMPGLESLQVSSCDRLEQVAELPALKSLDVFGYFTLENMLETPANMPALESLKVSGNILLENLANMPSLGSLTLNYCRALEQVAEMPTLRSLEVVACTSLKTLAHMPNIVDLKIDGADEATFLPSLKCLSHLEELRLKRFTEDISFGGLWQCIPKLKELWLIDFPNLKSLVGVNNITPQQNETTCPTDAKQQIECLSKLERLHISRCPALHLPQELRNSLGERLEEEDD